MLGGYSSCSSAWTIADVIVIRFFGITKIPWRAGRRGLGLGGGRGKRVGGGRARGWQAGRSLRQRWCAHSAGKGGVLGTFLRHVGTVVCHEPKRGGVCARPGQSRTILGELASWRVSTSSTLLSTSSPSSTWARDGNGSASREARSAERQKDCSRRGRRSPQRWSSRRRDAISGSRVNPGSSRLSDQISHHTHHTHLIASQVISGHLSRLSKHGVLAVEMRRPAEQHGEGGAAAVRVGPNLG